MSQPGEASLPSTLPIFPLNGVLLLPRGQLPLNVFEPRYLNLVTDALGAGRMLGMIQPMQSGESGKSSSDAVPLYSVGCCGRITTFQEQEDGRFLISLRGVCRFRIDHELSIVDGYRRVAADFSSFIGDLAEPKDTPIEAERLIAGLKAYFRLRDISADWDSISKASTDTLITTISMVCPFEAHEKQALLESPTVERRAQLLVGIIESSLSQSDDDTVVRH